ncbi:alpha-taxilin [Uranotaenia lowii]|uniref:alpha-taxilin n=1 Tax=Uranotaenia lowii TaxID=190385 RepID=UPI00247B2D1F|nr:alpha-taxilin [Uranotaenia lowii]XP_055593711.1 alpha-taxilin [Uranotaenia lowii]
MEVTNNGERHPAEIKKQMREDKQREAKIQDQLTKQLNGLSLDEKFNAVYKKLVESEKENKRLTQLFKQNERNAEVVKKERENMILEHNKVAMTKQKLEQLCRELQKQNRMIKEESMTRIKEEEEKRKETQAKFQKSLNEIQSVMDENNEKNLQLKEDNMEMAKKFKFILEQYELRDQQMDKMNKQMDLVTQLNDAKLAKVTTEAAMEKERFLKEKEIIINELTKVKKQLAELQMVEVHLREQVNMYSDKYGEFQDSLKKSHNIFVGYKGDMEKMSKKIKSLEKETTTWKTKWEKSNAALIDLMSEKQVRDEHIMKTARQLFHLQKLCRTLQNERTAYFAALQENNVEIPPVEEVPYTIPEPEPLPVAPKKEDKLEIMTKNCSALKENLAALQGQLSAMQSKGSEGTEKSSEPQPTTNGGKKNKKDKKGGKGAATSEPQKNDTEESEPLSKPDVAEAKENEKEKPVESPEDTSAKEVKEETVAVEKTEIPVVENGEKATPSGAEEAVKTDAPAT